ncbi:MAG: nucleotidyltransferase domain-containing protein [Paludibacteraceae bacterium]|nr:nucleotidyltransferase domain-containing protein [Paludibacteraceae bacterium]
MDTKIINTLCEFFKTKPVDKVWVFGSFSRGEETVQSDVDIIISITPGAKFSLLDHSKWVYQLEDLLQRPVDLVKDGTLLPFAVESANIDKVLVYERAA